MVMSIFEKDGKTYTRFKVRLKELKLWKACLKSILLSQSRKTADTFILRKKETGLMGRCKLYCPNDETECCICCEKQDSCQYKCDDMDSYEYAEECEEYETD